MVPTAALSPAKVATYVALAESEENKATLKAASEALVAEGAFGLPWLVAERADGRAHAFFGSDRFEVRPRVCQSWETEPARARTTVRLTLSLCLQLLAYFLDKRWDGPCPQGASARA